MKRLYEIEAGKKAEITKILDADPYSETSFARSGYKMRDGSTLGEDKAKLYLYISASDAFIKIADHKLHEIAKPVHGEAEKRIIEKIIAEEESAESGFGSMFG